MRLFRLFVLVLMLAGMALVLPAALAAAATLSTAVGAQEATLRLLKSFFCRICQYSKMPHLSAWFCFTFTVQV